LDIPRRWRFAP